ncbi:ferritin-like domain-containing protein [Sorangium sp. So ce887]|uniref:ferritin-like domain-containing protein n=1 Tax=Sorangium sp. So ce887 TaxID=3133324 RepID=UPI003F5FB714
MLLDGSFRRTLLARLLLSVGPSTAAALLVAAPGCGGEPEAAADIRCFEWFEELGACLDRDQALDELRTIYPKCEDYIESVESDATQREGVCCYEVTSRRNSDYCGVPGRPFMLEGHRHTAAPRAAEAGWLARGTASGSGGRQPSLADLTDEERETLADGWLRSALEEHASVASFARFSLDLMAHGAPSSLVEAAHIAALDEVGHARLGFSLASAYRGAPLGPAAFPMPPGLPVAADLVALARAVAEEGCVGETVAALVAAEQRARAEDPAVRAALEVIAEDEARHAELAWLTVAWAIGAGGEPVRRAVAEVFEAAAQSLRRPPLAEAEAPRGRPAALAAHGHLTGADLHALSSAAVAQVVLPCAHSLALWKPVVAAVTRFGYGPTSTSSVLSALECASAPKTPI